ncbi:MAG: LemA family protein [Elusimicrobia bacterium RIFOXYD2_FULL_34_15]|nr:MAG: LemA family protein [Elusimicrobia bacterium RIFOXYD2_FULL_34_15]
MALGVIILVLIIVGVLLFLLVTYIVGIYNQLIEIKVNIEKSWANIEILEKQRYDEIPKLIKICEGYMKYEKGTFEKITEARTRFLDAKTPSQMAQAGSDLSGALKTLFAVSENYPELKANDNFKQLQSRVSYLENQIADRREFYNESVAIFNTRIKQIPDILIANMLKYTEKEMYKISAEEKVSPEIKFDIPK